MSFFTTTVTRLKTVVTAIGAGIGVWGVINFLEGYGNDNPGANAHILLCSTEWKDSEILHSAEFESFVIEKQVKICGRISKETR